MRRSVVLLLWVVSACGEPAMAPVIGEPWAPDQAEKILSPGSGGVVSTAGAVGGHTMTATVSGLDAYTNVSLLGSPSSSVGSCNSFCVDLDAPVRRLGDGWVDGSGVAEIEVDLALGMAGHELHLQAVGKAGGASVLTPVHVTPVGTNTAPTAPVIQLDPIEVRHRDNVNVQYLEASFDADGDPITYDIDWVNEDGLQWWGDQLPDWLHEPGEVWTVRVVPNDGAEDGPSVTLDFTVGNAAPQASALTLDPLFPAPGEEVTCAWTFADDDGDPDLSTARWFVDDVDSGTGPSLPAPTTPGAEVRCEVEPFDGYDAGLTSATSLKMPGNVLVLVLDDVGVDKIGAYGVGSEIPPTPRIDALAEQGVLFREAWAQPVCSPTRAAVVTGRYAFRTGVGDAFDSGSPNGLPADETTIAELLAEGSGGRYTSTWVGKWHLSTHPEYLDAALTQGFDWYSGSIAGVGDAAYTSDGLLQTHFDWERVENGVPARSTVYTESALVDDALLRTQEMPQPWLMVVGLVNGHKPYHDPPAHLVAGPTVGTELDNQQYHAMIQATDTEIGRLLDGMDPELLARTTIIVMGDNGTKGDVVAPEFDPDRQKRTLYQGGVHVPLIVAGPQVREPGREVDALVHAVDVFSTVAEIANVAVPDDRVIDGVSLVPYLNDPEQAPLRTTVYSELFTPVGFGPYSTHIKAIRDARWKLIRSLTQDQFFDLQGVDIEGQDLYADGVLTADEQVAFDALVAQLPQ